MAIITQYAPGEGPEYKVRGVTRRVDRVVTGFAGSTHMIFQPAGTPRPRAECQPFTFTLAKPDGYNAALSVKAQEKFFKGLEKLTKAQARKDAARAKAAAKLMRAER